MDTLQTCAAAPPRPTPASLRGRRGARPGAAAQIRRLCHLSPRGAEEVLDWLDAQGVRGRLSFSAEDGFAVEYPNSA
jgi:hypothetical protein